MYTQYISHYIVYIYTHILIDIHTWSFGEVDGLHVCEVGPGLAPVVI